MIEVRGLRALTDVSFTALNGGITGRGTLHTAPRLR